MFRNYFKIAFRNLQRNKAYTIINVIGLSLGIACGILIFTLVSYHLSFDNFHNNKERIYRIVSEYINADGIEHQQGVQQPLGKAFRADYSLTDKVARVVVYRGGGLITLPDEPGMKKFVEEKGAAFAEPEFFDIFNFPLVQGDKATALTQPNSVVITQQIAKKFFGTENAIGKIIRYKFFAAFINFKVTGILKDLPDNTDRKQEIYFSYSNLKDGNPKFASDDNWHTVNSSMHCFIVLKKGVSKENAEKVFPAFAKKYLGAEDAKNVKYILQPLSDIHFNTDYDGYTDKKYLWSLAFVGIFLIVTACVNFINLATAQALNRSKEVGVRKVLGSLKRQLFWQFIAETTLITFCAVVIAYAFSQFAMPYLNNLFQTKIEINLFANVQLTGFLLLLIALVIFLSGSYPGLILSRFQPVAALKGKLTQKNVGGFSLRRILVVTQFAISQMLIIGTIVIAGQMHFSKTTDLGFNKDEIVMLPVASTDSIGKIKMETLKNRLAQVSGVTSISFCSEAPASEAVHSTDLRYNNRPKIEPFDVSLKCGDDKYLQTFAIKLAAGRNVFPSDTAMEFLVNETLVKKLGIKNPHEIINKNIQIGEKTAPVVGVVKDFYDQSFHSDKNAICILQQYHNYYNCAVKINVKDSKSALASFEKIWNQTYPEYLYSYQFLDDRISKFYELDNIMLQLIEAFACIAIFIGCLGLYGLVSFMALQKTKEIGVRKVLGASVKSVLWLFGKEFTRLLIIAFVIAAPIAWFAMNKYLQDFKYRIQIGFGIFLLAILSTFIIAAITVAYRSIKAALINPVKSLRSE
jgi:putative ABC transport system permease protein